MNILRHIIEVHIKVLVLLLWPCGIASPSVSSSSAHLPVQCDSISLKYQCCLTQGGDTTKKLLWFSEISRFLTFEKFQILLLKFREIYGL